MPKLRTAVSRYQPSSTRLYVFMQSNFGNSSTRSESSWWKKQSLENLSGKAVKAMTISRPGLQPCSCYWLLCFEVYPLSWVSWMDHWRKLSESPHSHLSRHLKGPACCTLLSKLPYWNSQFSIVRSKPSPWPKALSSMALSSFASRHFFFPKSRLIGYQVLSDGYKLVSNGSHTSHFMLKLTAVIMPFE